MDNIPYTLCKHCDHFVDENYPLEEGLAKFIHLEDGEQEFDHDAEPGETKLGEEWKHERPDLFIEHLDGAIGPNSFFHSRRGKDDGLWYYADKAGELIDRRLGVANRLFENWDFEPDVVKDAGVWQSEGNYFKMSVFMENGDEPSIKKEFIVKFSPGTTQVVALEAI